jgi:polysaccharide biosynthesis protein PslG
MRRARWRMRARCCVLVALLAVALSPAAPASSSDAIRAKAGFSVGGGWLSLPAAELDRDLAAMQAAHATWLRVTVSWANLEPAQGTYAWNKATPPTAVKNLELVLRGAAARGLRVIAVVTTSPAWARPAGCTSSACAPARPSDYAAFVEAAALRYRAAPFGVHMWEVWNMPNTKAFHKPAPDVATYTALLQASHPAIHRADPAATVLLGGLGAGHRNCPTASACIAPLSFLTSLYDAGAGGSFDGVDLHAVSEDAAGHPISPRTAGPGNVFAQLPKYRTVMVDHGDRGKVWAEITYSSLDGVTEAQQATWVGQALERWVTYGWTGALAVYNFRDMPGEMSGLIRQDLSPKPAYDRFAALAA